MNRLTCELNKGRIMVRVVSIVLPYENPEIMQKLSYISDCVLKVVPETESIILFGSYAYGEPNKDSDLDIYVVVPDSVKERELDLMTDIYHEIHSGDFMSSIDVLVSKAGRFREHVKQATIARTVAKEGVVIYGQSRTAVV